MLVQVTLKNNLLYKLDYFKIKYKGLHTRSATISTANQAKSEVIRLRFVGCSHEHEHIMGLLRKRLWRKPTSNFLE